MSPQPEMISKLTSNSKMSPYSIHMKGDLINSNAKPVTFKPSYFNMNNQFNNQSALGASNRNMNHLNQTFSSHNPHQLPFASNTLQTDFAASTSFNSGHSAQKKSLGHKCNPGNMAMPDVKHSLSQMQHSAQNMMSNSPYLQFPSTHFGQSINSERFSQNKSSLHDSQTMREY